MTSQPRPDTIKTMSAFSQAATEIGRVTQTKMARGVQEYARRRYSETEASEMLASSELEGDDAWCTVGVARVLAECAAKRRIIELHKSWPVLIETPPKFEQVDGTDTHSFAMRASQQIAWKTEQQYREQFGSEPPTGPILRAMASVSSDDPAFDSSWAL